MTLPKEHSALRDDVLYEGDNGRVYHGRCSGFTARYTGYDLSGMRVRHVPAAVARRDRLYCERCES